MQKGKPPKKDLPLSKNNIKRKKSLRYLKLHSFDTALQWFLLWISFNLFNRTLLIFNFLLKQVSSKGHLLELPHKGSFLWFCGFEPPSSFSEHQCCFLILWYVSPYLEPFRQFEPKIGRNLRLPG